MQRSVRLAILTIMLATAVAHAGNADEILGLLDDFLAHAGEKSAHERFWADDLVYTSSRGTRTTKAGILASFDGEDESVQDAPGPVYTADEVQLKLLGDTAIVAFRLVATPPGDGPVDYYFNTGTFVKRDGEWRVLAWQATTIPPALETGSE